MKSFGVLDNPVNFTLGVYFHHCAIAMSCRQLAMAGRYLAWSGVNPSTGHSVVSVERARRINAVMLTCGHYDGSGNSRFGLGAGKKRRGRRRSCGRARQGFHRGMVAGPRCARQLASWPRCAGKLSKRIGWSIFGV